MRDRFRSFPRRNPRRPADAGRRRCTPGRIALAAIPVAGLLVAVLTLLFGDGLLSRLTGGDGGGEAKLELKDTTVFNEPLRMRAGGQIQRQTRESLPRVEVTVENRGDAVALLTNARVTIEDDARLPTCYTQGGGDVTVAWPDVIVVPEWLRDEERVVDRPLKLEVEPGQLQAVNLRFTTPEMEREHLYAVHVELMSADHGAPIDAGRFVLAVPGPLARVGTDLPENGRLLASGAPLSLYTTWCYRANLAAARRLARQPGERSPRVAALDTLTPAAGWERWGDRAPAAEAARRLLRDEHPEALMAAVFAAEASGDVAVVTRTRRTAAEALLLRAERRLAEGSFAGGAISDARASLLLRRSQHGEELLARAERERARELAAAGGP